MAAETIFKALSDETRQRTLRVLREHELSVSEVVQVLDLPQSTVSRHLKTLREANLLRDRRVGHTVMYEAPEPAELVNGSDLPKRLVEWVDEQPLSPQLASRLQSVLSRRREQNERFFESLGNEWDDLREQSFGRRFHLEAGWSLIRPSWTVADLGTGTGYLLPVLARRAKRVIAVEAVQRMCEVARERVRREGLKNVDVVEGDLASSPIDDGAIDLALSALVLHHVSNPREAIEDMYRVVKPGGLLLLVEQRAHEDERFRSRMNDRWWGFDPAELSALARRAGFSSISVSDLTSVDRAVDAPDLFVVTAEKPAIPGM